jgi:hypothetical protein
MSKNMYICELCGKNNSMEDSFICTECDASQCTDYTYNPTTEDEQEAELALKQSEDHSPISVP